MGWPMPSACIRKLPRAVVIMQRFTFLNMTIGLLTVRFYRGVMEMSPYRT